MFSRIRNLVWLCALILCFGPAVYVHAERSAGQTVDDTTLATSVKYILTRAENVPVGSINVEVYKGIVQLSGFIHKEAQKALSSVREVNGVVATNDGLVLTDVPRSLGHFIDDQTIQAKLKAKIGDSLGVGTAVSVVTHVRNGAVIVAGFVGSKKEINTVVETAKSISGVTKVHNRLLVRQAD